jgi:hypothetical protein
MDGAGDDWVGWTADGLAAAILAAAVGTCLLLLGEAQAAVIAASSTGMLALAALRQVKPEPRRFRLPDFTVAAPDEGGKDALLLTEVAEPEALLLDDPLVEAESDSRVVQLFAARALPTPGELQQRIEAHLAAPQRPAEAGSVIELEVDAAAALRQALGELRRSLA